MATIFLLNIEEVPIDLLINSNIKVEYIYNVPLFKILRQKLTV